MVMRISCDCKNCYNNNDGECEADFEIEIICGECVTYEPIEEESED